MRAVIACAIAGASLPTFGQERKQIERPAPPHYEARLEPLAGSGVTGLFTFSHAPPFVAIRGTARGLPGKGRYAMHVHEGKSCDKPGDHFNPAKAPHGSPDQPHDMRHVGDLGNLAAPEDKTAHYSRIDALARLDGPHSIVGRVLVVHERGDDYVTQPSGDAGREIACGPIRPAPMKTR